MMLAAAHPSRDNPPQALVVDDAAANRSLLTAHLRRQGVIAVEAESGKDALHLLSLQKFDVVLLDVQMPGMDGVQILGQMKRDPILRETPVLMVSALDDLDVIVRCLELGADDYLPKPFVPAVLRARISACVEKSRLRDERRQAMDRLREERDRADSLLLNVLPRRIADRLKSGAEVVADSFPEATILFADIVGFTAIASDLAPVELLQLLDGIFSGFDRLAEQHGLEKIKTTGDAWMVAGGIPEARADHAAAIAELALELSGVLSRCAGAWRRPLEVRIGISSGPAIAGVIGRRKFIYDVWGDAVNVASRMEASGAPGRIHVSASTYELLRDRYDFEERGEMLVKGKGAMRTWFLRGRSGR